MKKAPKQAMYKKFSIRDAIVILISLAAIIALVIVVKYSDNRSRMEREKLLQTGSNYTPVIEDMSLSDAKDYLVINEVNKTGWIELYNKNRSTGIRMAKGYITINGEKKYTFPEQSVIKANEFLSIEGLGQLGNQSSYDMIGIYDEKENNLHNLIVPRLNQEESYGRKIDGELNYSFLTPTKTKTNNASKEIKTDQLFFSVPGGFYDESFRLEITGGGDSTIYYTLDGSTPTAESEVYKESILIENKSGSNILYANTKGIEYLYGFKPTSINMGMVVRAIQIDSSGTSSKIETQSYFVGLKEESGFRNFPVLSITTAPENLFDYFDGIYVSGRSYEDALARGEDGGSSANYLNGNKREVHVEYFEPQKDKTFERDMSISIIKDSSVTLAQKSFLLEEQISDTNLGSSLKDYYNDVSNKLVVQTNRRDNNYKVREYLAKKLLEEAVGTPDIIPCIVFINGEYWGGYMLRAEYDQAYMKKNYNLEKENVIIAQNDKVTNKQYQPLFDELYSFITTKDLKEENNYNWVKSHMDVQNYLKYFCANMYLANADYGQDTRVMFRTINTGGTGNEDGKWRFLMPKLDNTMDNGAAGNVATSSINSFLQVGVTEDVFLQALLRNEEFKRQLVVVMTNMAREIFSIDSVNKAILQITEEMQKMVEGSYKRFIGNPVDSFYSKETDKIKNFFKEREKYVLLYTEELLNLGGNSHVANDAISE